MSYEFTSRIRYSEIGPDGRLTLGGLVDYFQDCCVFHSESIGITIDDWARRGSNWVIVSWRIIINDYPRLYDHVTTKTWGYRFLMTEGDRNLTMRSAEDGRLLAYADSRWIYVDMRRGRPIKVVPEETAYGTEPQLSMKEMPRHVMLPENYEVRPTFPVIYEDLDTNGHVNNRRYIQMGMNYLPEGFDCAELLIDYHSQAREGDVVVPKVAETEEGIIISLDSEMGRAYSVMEFRRRKSDFVPFDPEQAD